MQKYKAKKEVVEEITGKLQANKNIFSRGDFDDYKIKNLGVTEDGHTYNLDNPTERYYYELKKELEKKRADSCNEDIEKAYGTKYKSKKLINGKWRYYYADGREESVKWHDHNANKSEIREFINESFNNSEYKENIKICDLPSHFSDKLKLKIGVRPTKLIMNSDGVRHSLNLERHNINPEDILLLQKVIQNKHTIIRNAGKSKRRKNDLIEFTGYSRGTIKFILAIDEKNKELRLFDCYRDGKIEKSVRFLCTCPETNALDGSQPTISIRFINDLSSNINKSLTYSGYKLQGRTKLYDMDISIENKKGSYRSGVDSDGHKWRTYMNYDYGYVRHTEGTDGDFVDVYIGPDKKADKVYVIHQNNPVTHKYDEDKCMLCFESADAAKKAYMKQYDRPGFFGSMETLTIEQFKSFVFSKKGKRIHKSFDVCITDITDNNKNQKIEQLQKSLNALYLNKPFVIKHIEADTDSHKYEPITMRISNFDKNKIEKAVHKMAMTLDAEIKSTSFGEAFNFKCQEELTDELIKEITQKTNSVYQFVIDYFDLPEIRIVSKSVLRHKGKIIYDPETGKPIEKSTWDKFVKALEDFLNRNYKGIGEKIVLKGHTLGRILSRLAKTNSLEALKKKPLSEMTYKHRTFDWISENTKNMKDVFGDTISRETASRVEVACHSAAIKVTKVTDNMRNDIQDIIIDGVKNKESRSKISQKLFDKCVGLNRDFQRIADTEIQNNTNMAYLKEEVYNTEENEKVYFKRFEILDDNTCKQCRKIKGKIALWSDVALPDERIKDEYADYAIWEGKESGDMPVSVKHCYCRGSWFRYYPDIK